jgi:CubicO group peptidase (beta-lactamase class C family)
MHHTHLMLRLCLFLLLSGGLAPDALAKAPPVNPPQGIAAQLEPFVKDHSIAGAITLVVGENGILSLETVGQRDLAAQIPMQEDTLFWIASMTKPITAMAVMMLVEDGKMQVDDPVEKHLPEFRHQMLLAENQPGRQVLIKPTRPITVKDLLTHTCGLVSKSPLQAAVVSPCDELSLDKAVLSYALSPLQFQPGTKWSYCNPGITTLGRLVEIHSGMSYETFLKQRLFQPLGMKDTTFFPTGEQTQRLATAYQRDADKDELEQTTIGYLSPDLEKPGRTAWPAGGLFSTARDLARFYQMLIHEGELDGHRYLRADTLKTMATNQLGDLPDVSFTPGMAMGLGFHIVKQPQGVTDVLSPGSYGHGGAYGTQGWVDPKHRLAYVLLFARAGLNADKSDIRGTFQRAAAAKFKNSP